jgi:hypothetical protein
MVARQSTLRFSAQSRINNDSWNREPGGALANETPKRLWHGGALQCIESLLPAEIFLEPMVRIWFITEGLHLDEPNCLVEMLCFRERAVSLPSQDHHSAWRGRRRQSFQQTPPQSKPGQVRSHPHSVCQCEA